MTMNEENNKPVVTTIRFAGDEIELFEQLKSWAFKHHISMAEAVKRAIALLLSEENAAEGEQKPSNGAVNESAN